MNLQLLPWLHHGDNHKDKINKIENSIDWECERVVLLQRKREGEEILARQVLSVREHVSDS